MAIIYIGAGSNTSPYDTEAKAATTLAAALAVVAAGDEIRVSHTHSENLGSSFVLVDLKGTITAPTKVISYNFSTDSATVGAEFYTAGSSSGHLFWYGYCYCWGITLRSGNANDAGIIILSYNGGPTVFEKGLLELRTGGASNGHIRAGDSSNGGDGQEVILRDTDMKFSASSQTVGANAGILRWLGGAIRSGSSTPDDLFVFSAGAGKSNPIVVEGVDFSNFSGNWDFIGETFYSTQFDLKVRNCKLNSGWAGALIDSGWVKAGGYAVMHNCDGGDTNYRFMEQSVNGIVRNETTIVRTGGASDGTTALSWKLTSSANCVYPVAGLRSPEIVVWVDSPGSPMTIGIEVVHDSQGSGSGSKLTDAEAHIEVQYLGTSGYPLASIERDIKAYLASATNQDDSSETWTTTGLTAPVKQRLEVTVTPQEKGYVHARAVLTKPSVTIYACPELV